MKRKIYTLFRAALALCLMFCLTLPVFAGGADPAAGETDESVFAERYVNDAKLVGLNIRPLVMTMKKMYTSTRIMSMAFFFSVATGFDRLILD